MVLLRDQCGLGMVYGASTEDYLCKVLPERSHVDLDIWVMSWFGILREESSLGIV